MQKTKTSNAWHLDFIVFFYIFNQNIATLVTTHVGRVIKSLPGALRILYFSLNHKGHERKI